VIQRIRAVGVPLDGPGYPARLRLGHAVNVGAPELQAAVPEPGTWAMMILGFAGVGFMAYRRRDQGSAFRFA
jgi:hypothetical protein